MTEKEKTQPVQIETPQKSFYKKVNTSLFIQKYRLSTPRLMAAAKEVNVGKDTLIDFLVSKGFRSDLLTPTSKLDIEMYLAVVKEFLPSKLDEFELNEEDFQGNNDYYLILSFEDGRFVVRQQNTDGSVVYADSLETISKIFLPFYRSTTNVIKELEELINWPNVSENDIQKFLERYPELILHNDYKEAIPQARIVTESNSWEADFVLVPFQQEDFCKVLELKLPKEKIFKTTVNGHMQLSAKLHHSLSQIKDYHHAFNSEKVRNTFRQKYGTDVYRPELELIIGRKGDMQIKSSFKDHQKDTGVKITDWDTFLEKRKRMFK